MKARLIIEDGQVFVGDRFGAEHDVITEMVFNTGVTGYVELLTDPSYAGQGVVMSSPIIGNYGVFENESESAKPWLDAYVVRYLTSLEDDPRKAENLDVYLKRHGVAGLSGVDTRMLTLTIREKGTMKGMITSDMERSVDECLNEIKNFKCESKVPVVSCKEKWEYKPGDLGVEERQVFATVELAKAYTGPRFKVALIDYGAKSNIVRLLHRHGCDVTVYPFDTDAQEILAGGFDGVMLSNGPGDPKECVKSIDEVKKLYDSGIPMFGICLGHQLMALALGFDTYKLKYGHRGINHTVKDLELGRCFITSQNHSYCVDTNSVDSDLAVVSHININDGSVEGMKYLKRKVFTVQFHPEGAPGPVDTEFLFDRFTEMMRK